jgi:integrase
MAWIEARRNKAGKLISYRIRFVDAFDGSGKPVHKRETTFSVEPTWAEKTAKKKAETFAAQWEQDVRNGSATDSRVTFKEYAEYVLSLKERNGLNRSTLDRYHDLTRRIYPAIGAVKLKDLTPRTINEFYKQLSEMPLETAHCTGKPAALKKALGKRAKCKICAAAGIAPATFNAALSGSSITKEKAEAIASALGKSIEKLFSIETTSATLSAKTIRAYAVLISTVLDQAEKELLIPFNPAEKASPPKVTRPEVNYFQPDDVGRIEKALDAQGPMWRALGYLFIVSGCRRSEILGLHWDSVDFTGNRIYITETLKYSASIGLYSDGCKTSHSKRFVSLPASYMPILAAWKMEQARQRVELGTLWGDDGERGGFCFTGAEGKPIHPDSVTVFWKRLEKENGLPHLNSHAFRHTQASLLIFNGADIVTVAARLGHAQASTTENIYAHVIEQADKQSAEIVESVFMRQKTG